MAKRTRIDAETLERWDRERRDFRVLFQRRLERIARIEAREASRQAPRRRLTFGLLGREPSPDTDPTK